MARDWREDRTIIRIIKLRKRHVRLALQRQENARRVAAADRPCGTCGINSVAVYENGKYKGHECTNGHYTYVSKRVRDPLAPIIPTERADPRGMPSGGHAPPPIDANELAKMKAHTQQLQQDILKKTGIGKKWKAESAW